MILYLLLYQNLNTYVDKRIHLYYILSVCPLCSHKPRPKSFGQTFSKVCGVLGQRPESPLASGEIPLSSVKGRRGELSCQSNSRGEPTRSEGFSFICAQILYTVQTASTSSVTRDFASQNISLRERDCHLPHGGRLKNAPFRLYKPTDKSKFEIQTSPLRRLRRHLSRSERLILGSPFGRAPAQAGERGGKQIKFKKQTSSSGYAKTGFIKRTPTFARGGFPARLKI